LSVTSAIRRMIESGLTLEQALIAAEAFEAENDNQPVLNKRQERNRRYYENRKASEKRLNSDDQDVSDAGAGLSSPEGSSPTPPSPKPLQSIPPSPPKGGSSPTDRAISVFVEQASKAGLPVPRKVTADRRRKIEARVREHGEDVWAEACRRMASSAFCRGDNDRGWRADLDFLCQPKSFNGLIEGKYDDRPSQRSQAPPRRESDWARYQREGTEALERSVYGDQHEQPSSNGPAFDLEPGDWRSHGKTGAG